MIQFLIGEFFVELANGDKPQGFQKLVKFTLNLNN